MYEEKSHLCTGNNCIFCRIFTGGQGWTGGHALLAEQSLARVKELSQTDTVISKGIPSDQIDRLAVIERLAFYDQLTGIYNAHAFMKELQEEVARAQRYKRPLSICVVKIDQFNDIRIKYGPLGGEMVLKHAAAILKESLRGVDMAAYYQNDKFAIVLPETNNAGAVVVAERLAKKLTSRPAKLHQQNVTINVSIGVATFLKHGQSRDELIRSALAAVAG